MEDAWRASTAEATDEATSPHPVIVGAGAPKAAPRPRSFTKPRLHVSRPLESGGGRFTFPNKGIVPDVTHACGPQAPRTPPMSRTPPTPRPPRRRDKRAPLGEGATGTELRSSATQATRARALLGPGPTTLGTVYGPDPGAPVGVLK